MVLFPNPTGGAPLNVANEAEARAQGWTPSMGSMGIQSYPDSGGGSSGGGGGGGNVPPAQGGGDLGGQIDRLLQAIASGNKQAFDETVREFNLTYGLDHDKFTDDVRRFNENLALTQSGVTGTYQGQQTQQAVKQASDIALANAGLTGTFQGAPTLAAQQQQYAQQLGLVTAAQTAQANPFRQQQLYGQANRILAGQPAAGFQAPGTVAGVGTAGGNTQGGLGYLQQIIDDIKNPTANQTTADSFLAQTPTPNKIDSASFLRSNPSSQNLILQAMQEKYGIDPSDALSQIKNTLPQFTAPSTFGQVRR